MAAHGQLSLNEKNLIKYEIIQRRGYFRDVLATKTLTDTALNLKAIASVLEKRQKDTLAAASSL